MKIGIIGSGDVAKACALGFASLGHEVRLGLRDPAKVQAWAEPHGIGLDSHRAVADWAEAGMLAVKGSVAVALAKELSSALVGKTVIDPCNPIADAPPDGAVLRYFTAANDSLLEQLMRAAPQVHWVKAFNSVGSAHMFQPKFAQGRPTMYYCGADAGAKAWAAAIIRDFGWEAEDVGGPSGARPLEALCQLWCARGFLTGSWDHAFALFK